jgi:heme/copper-type cytochrome/quinol oxidase subunit 2
MEAQPIALALFFIPILFLGTQIAAPPLDQGTIALILVGLHWWALLTQSIVRHSGNEQLIKPLRVQGLILACIFTFGLLLLTGHTVLELIIPAALILWAWRRGIQWTTQETHEERLITTFKIGFITLVVILILSMLYYSQVSSDTSVSVPQNYMLPALAQALPLFFLSGLITLSLSRLEMIRKDSMRNTPGRSRLDPTRTWRLMLALTWTALVTACVILETYSLAPLRALFIPLWNLVLALLEIMLYAVFALLSFLIKPLTGTLPAPAHPRLALPPTSHHGHMPSAPSLPPAIVSIALLTMFILVLLLVFLIIQIALRQRRYNQDEDGMHEEEERESLPISRIWQTRREEHHRLLQDTPAMEALDPASARAHYRALLLTMLHSRTDLIRHAQETPLEYQQRLTSALNNLATHREVETPPDPAILAELTNAYMNERYGSKQLNRPQKSFLGRWVPSLLQHLIRRE